ncbi:MAG: response regulator [Defluviitaleaceae bacterium]|nr:response regulator [Defluviitaleaceae bacterium]
MTNDILNRLPCMAYQCAYEPNFPFAYVSDGCEPLTGYTYAELTEGGLMHIVHEDDVQKIEKLYNTTLATGQSLEVSFWISTKSDGKKRVLSRSYVLETNETGDPYIIEGILTDITKPVQNEVALIENRESSDFWEKLGYGIRTPMNAILGLSELGLRSDIPENVREYTHQIANSGKKLMQTINNVFDYKKLELGDVKITQTKYEPAVLVEELKTFTRELETDLEFKLYVDKEIPSVLIGDVGKLRQVLQNLISNAVKFTDSGYISLSFEGKILDDILSLEISVDDTGRGIREEDKDSVFTPFAQLDTKKVDGIGLGLAISKELVEMMGGTINFTSSAGSGSVFTVTVPQHICDEPQFAVPKKSRINFKKPNFIAPDARILVVDDIKANLTVAEGFLRSYKINVDLCESGAKAIEAVKFQKYDLILMDYLMPEMNGAEAAAEIRKVTKNIPIIAQTANSAKMSERYFRENLLCDFLPKPIDAGELNEILERWLPPKKRVPVSENAPAARPSPKLSKMRIMGIDIKKGVAKMGDNSDIYLRVLKEYFDSGTRLTKELRLCAERGDLKTYHIYAHALNSISENIGAIEISREAASLEKAAERGDLSFVAINNSIFTGKLVTLLNNIHAAIKDEQIAAPRVIEGDEGKRKILLIDDTPSYLLFLSDILQDKYEPLTSINARDGIETARLTKPDLILLDLLMPGISGYEALEILKADDELKNIPVILISGKDQKENEGKGRALGAVGYVKKPFDADAVKKKVAAVLAG